MSTEFTTFAIGTDLDNDAHHVAPDFKTFIVEDI